MATGAKRTSLEGQSWNAEKGIDDAQAIQKLLNIQLRYPVWPKQLVGKYKSINRPLFVLGWA